MTYNPTEWKAGDVVTSEKLNKLEQGVAGSVVNTTMLIDAVAPHLDKTVAELRDALYSGAVVVVITPSEQEAQEIEVDIIRHYEFDDRESYYGYYFETLYGASYFSATEDGYPTSAD